MRNPVVAATKEGLMHSEIEKTVSEMVDKYGQEWDQKLNHAFQQGNSRGTGRANDCRRDWYQY